MKTSKTRSSPSCGFTLIEVLVALSIVIIAFMAMYGSMTQVVAATTIMQDKTIATWIAFDRITELRVAESFPEDDKTSGELTMGGLDWVYTIRLIDTESDNIRQVIVEVAPELEPDNILGLATGVVVRAVEPPGDPTQNGTGFNPDENLE